MSTQPQHPETRPHAPPPATASALLAKAHVLSHSGTDVSSETAFGAIAACGVMLYGVVLWRQAEHGVRVRFVEAEEAHAAAQENEADEGDGDEDEGSVQRGVDSESGVHNGRSWSDDLVAGCPRRAGVGGVERDRITLLVQRALREVREWDAEVGRRMGFVLREVDWGRVGG